MARIICSEISRRFRSVTTSKFSGKKKHKSVKPRSGKVTPRELLNGKMNEVELESYVNANTPLNSEIWFPLYLEAGSLELIKLKVLSKNKMGIETLDMVLGRPLFIQQPYDIRAGMISQDMHETYKKVLDYKLEESQKLAVKMKSCTEEIYSVMSVMEVVPKKLKKKVDKTHSFPDFRWRVGNMSEPWFVGQIIKPITNKVTDYQLREILEGASFEILSLNPKDGKLCVRDTDAKAKKSSAWFSATLFEPDFDYLPE